MVLPMGNFANNGINQYLLEILSIILLEIPFDTRIRTLPKNYKLFAPHQFDIAVKSFRQKNKSLFYCKDENAYSHFKIHEGSCSSSASYIGETKQSVIVHWNEHENPYKESQPAKHVRNFPYYEFDWEILLPVLLPRNYARSWNYLEQLSEDLV